jgi:hypothetical protein
MSTKFSLFTVAGAPALTDQVVGIQGAGNAIYTLQQLATLFGVKKYAATIGDGSSVSYVVNHAMGTRDVRVTVYRVATPYDEIIADVQHTDLNNVTILFSTAPSVNQFRVLVEA